MTLATADENHRPSVRTVLLKYFDEQGFVAIGMPLVISIVGWAYIFTGLKSKD